MQLEKSKETKNLIEGKERSMVILRQ